MRLLERISTVEFYGYDKSSAKVEYNSRVYSLLEFIGLAKRDSMINLVLVELKKKMSYINYKGTLIEFILNVLGDKNRVYDVVLQTSSEHGKEKVYVKFDGEEINNYIKRKG